VSHAQVHASQKLNLNSQDREFWWVVGTLGNSVVRRDARKKNRKLPDKNLLQKESGALSQRKCPAEINSIL
jgi:hypothetical protein